MKPSMTLEVLDLTLSFMEGLNCPRALSMSILFRHGEFEEGLKLKADPLHYCTAEDYFRAASASDFLRKCDFRVEGIDPAASALASWLEAEKQCFLTNQKLNEFIDFGTLNSSPADERLFSFVKSCKNNVEWLIGKAPPHLFDGRFGPGATVSDRGGMTTVAHKMSSSPTLTPEAFAYLVPWTGSKWAKAVSFRNDSISFVRGNRFALVPKTALTDRPIAIEPSINGFYQLGLGRVIRDRLDSKGINLSNGQDVHRRVACTGSKTGSWSTIDLKSASDTVSEALVRLLLPPAWYQALSDLRSPFTEVNGHWYRLEKFSSMGNGYTFELETLIFLALAMTMQGPQALPGQSVFVYGDDIIVPSSNAKPLLACLKFFGLTPNMGKTFFEGSFRESCGGDYFNGEDVRPYFLKELPNEPQHYIALANGIRRTMRNLHVLGGDVSGLRRTWFKTLDKLPSRVRTCRGPEELGDLVIHDEERFWAIRWRANGYRYVRVYRPIPGRGIGFNRFDPHVQYAAALYGVALVGQAFKDGVSPPVGYDNRRLLVRDDIAGYKVGWTPFS